MEPFFSIIIPCYNCSETIERLLDSIYSSNLLKNEYEVIICDDKSTDNFLELVKPYEEKMNIVYCETTRDFHCPGNTREAALPYAKGEWICFADNDDIFEESAFALVKEYIQTNNLQHTLVTSFCQYDAENDRILQTFIGEKSDTWLHGKFYNRKNVIEKYNIHFKEDLFSHEDLFFNNSILGHLIVDDLDFVYVNDIFTYKWTERPDSLSRSYFSKEHYYIEEFLADYMNACSEMYFTFYKEYPEKADFFRHQILMSFMHGYFYYQASLYRIGYRVLGKNLAALHDFKMRIIDELGMSPFDMINYFYQDANFYNKIKINCYDGTNPFIESESLKDFILRI